MKELNERTIFGYCEGYKSHFQRHRHNQLAHCNEYLQGLFHESKSNITQMTERVIDSDAQNLNH